jgi:hypothetical protein
MKEILYVIISSRNMENADNDEVMAMMQNASTLIDDLVYSLASNIATRFLDVAERSVVTNIMENVVQDFQMGKITIRKRPMKREPGSKAKNPKRDKLYNEVMERTKSKKREGLVWKSCNSIENRPGSIRGMVYCDSEELGLEDGCAVLASDEDDNIVVYGIINEDLMFRYLSRKESSTFKSFSLDVDEDSVKTKGELKFTSMD